MKANYVPMDIRLKTQQTTISIDPDIANVIEAFEKNVISKENLN